MLSGHRGLQRIVVHLESGPSHLQALVTKPSSAPTPHYVRRGWVCQGNQGLRLRAVGAIGFASAKPRIRKYHSALHVSVLHSDLPTSRISPHSSKFKAQSSYFE
jgi:hypothetical protein